ncbi:MAG: peptidyl-prolyl cis-trans isomerase [bacterium]
MNKTKFILAALVFWGVHVLGCEQPEEQRNVIATVGNEKLTINELIEEIPPTIRSKLNATEVREFVLQWINSQVLYQEALAQKLNENGDYQKELDRLQRELLINKLIEYSLADEVSVTDEEISSYFDANKEEFKLSQDVIHAYHVLLKTRKEASRVSKRLKAGEDFATVFAEVNTDSSNGKSDDWDLGYFSRDDIAPEISNVVFNLRKGAISIPIKSAFGYHVVQVVDKLKKGEVKNFDLVKDEIRLKLAAQKKQDRYERFLLQMKSKHPYQTDFQLLDSSLDSLIDRGVSSQ